MEHTINRLKFRMLLLLAVSSIIIIFHVTLPVPLKNNPQFHRYGVCTDPRRQIPDGEPFLRTIQE